MSSRDGIEFHSNHANNSELARHLKACDNEFIPKLSLRVDPQGYADKLEERAYRFEAWSGTRLVGLVAAYVDCLSREMFVTNVSVEHPFSGMGIASRLLAQCLEFAKTKVVHQVRLCVSKENIRAIRLYERHGFTRVDLTADQIEMTLHLKGSD